MNYVPIPLAALESPKYLALSIADRQFVIDLYAIFHDCQRFTIDLAKPEQYRQPRGASLARKIARLIDADLLYVSGSFKNRRVFSFTHLAAETVQEAA